ncbi:MAG: MBL fold metallo-hydrolase [Pseudomonadota bacterium]
MQIRLLTENLASEMPWLAEWGFSAWIEHDGACILFDTGFSEVWVRNARHAGIDLNSVDVIALSHFHRDHTRGLLSHPFKDRKRLICHPRVLKAVLETEDHQILDDYANIQRTLSADFEIEASRDAVEIAPGAFFLGEIPRVTTFERGAFFDDPMPDDTALAFRTDRGAVVVSGCSHAGICNICEHAKTITGQDLHAVLGGFHLLHDEDPPVEATMSYLTDQGAQHLMPMHCIDFDIQVRLAELPGYSRPGAGSLIKL